MLLDLEKAQYKIYLWTDKQFNPGVVILASLKPNSFCVFDENSLAIYDPVNKNEL